jgi:hypothetical protein
VITLSKATEPTTKRGEGEEESEAIKSAIREKWYIYKGLKARGKALVQSEITTFF